MKYLLRFVFVATVMGIGLIIMVSSAIMQGTHDKKISATNFEDCVKVTLIADSDKYKLKKDSPISVVVRIVNISDERLKLSHEPIFNFRRVGIKQDKTILGDSYTGRIVSQDFSSSENLFLEKGGYLDFVVDITDLELKDVITSIDVWRNIFQELEKGEYNVQAEAVIDFSDNEKTYSKGFLSNKITVSYTIGTEK